MLRKVGILLTAAALGAGLAACGEKRGSVSIQDSTKTATTPKGGSHTETATTPKTTTTAP